MNGFAVGPLLFSTERVAALLGLVVVLVGAEILARRLDPRFSRWSYLALGGGLVAARLGHVLENAASFAAEPWRVLAIWQGGFSLPWAALPVAIITVLALPRPRLMAWGVASLAAGLLAWNTVHQLSVSTRPETPLPALTLETLAGPPLALAETQGRPTVINIWATWCPPCRREMPVLAQAAQANPDVRFVFANQAEDAATIRTYLARQGLELPNVALDATQAIPRHYETLGIPITLFVGPDGRLATSHTGEISPEQLNANLARLR
jgi:thiol-disulfide isomerase/thioredoxin